MAKKKIGSIKNELATKSREAMLSAVEIYNNPNIQFKSETFIILAIIAWTYLLHSYYRSKHIDYTYHTTNANGRKKYDRTRYGAKKCWELERCLNCDECPLDNTVKENLKFLIGIRHEIEHQMTTRIDDALSAKFQACCINYNEEAIKLLGEQYGISRRISFSLQFASLSEPQKEMLSEVKNLPKNIETYITEFDENLTDEVFNDPHYSYRVLFFQKVANRKGQADRVIEFLPADSPLAEELNKEYIVVKDREKPKYLPKDIIQMMKNEGFSKINQYHFKMVWKDKIEKKANSPYGCFVAGSTWYWYENFIPLVRQYCEDNNLR
ncbi:DUF3644 domain-containing protein [Segatella bryantii]|uniref:DUF3644 domain-containing protein n=1 Tax=Segatella bryantii TaxID=77095 RepID=UPI00242DA66E|nr:DUF3644 domain-containing protein [Segatella bryantii]